MARLILVLAVVALTVYALVDCIQADERQIRTLPKAGWIPLIVLLVGIGPLAWFFVGRPRTLPPRGNQGPARPRGPEDDPDFLRNL